MSGWIRLHSKFTKWEWYRDQNTKDLFIHCLLKANWKDGKFEGIVIPRGSFVTSLDTLSKELGLSVQAIRTSLKHLISTKELTSKSTNKYRIITIINYELYQQVNIQTNNQLTNNQQATNNQLTTIEEYIDNVCNNTARAHARERNPCHLGSKFKNEFCRNCLKKEICTNPVSSEFKLKHPEGFINWLNKVNDLYENLSNSNRLSNEELYLMDNFLELEGDNDEGA